MTAWPTSTVVAGAAFIAGLVFGAVAQPTRFCAMGAIADVVVLDDYRRLRAWLLSIAVALPGTQLLHSLGLINVYQSIYLTPTLGWFGAIAGGLLFGYGMTLSGGCGHRTLVHLGEGNLRSLVVAMTLGMCAYMTLRGLTGVARLWIENATNLDLRRTGLASQSLVDILAASAAVPAALGRWLLVALIAAVLFWYCLKDAAFRASTRHIIAGLTVGALVISGWCITGWLGVDEFEPTPVVSFTFVAPIGDALQYLMTFTGASLTFGIAAVFGVLCGAWVMAICRGEFHLEGFTDTSDLLRHLTGGALMGIGGVLALGCTIGQGVTGMSTLALGSLLAWLAILAGGWCGIRHRQRRSRA